VVRLDGSQHGKTKEVKIPLTSKASFGEILDSAADHLSQTVDQLARQLRDSRTKILVHLIQPSEDVGGACDDDLDLPRDTDITMTTVS